MKRIVIIVLFTVSVSALYGQKDTALDSVLNNIAQQLLIFPQEKIYLQTDKPYYINGEKIFFRAFLLDAFSNKQDTLSRYVYVELINPADSVVQRVKIRQDENNLFYGAITLRADLPQGDYSIRAYTQYMQNQGESSFFSKQVLIGDPRILKEQTLTDFRFAKDRKTNKGDFDVTFYPEGGQLIAGQVSDVAFKDEHYQAICHNGEHTLRFDLPEAQSNTIALKAIILNNKLQIMVNKSESVSLPGLYLLIHSRGSVVYAKAYDPVKNAKVLLMSLTCNFYDQTETDKNGRYVFRNFEFPDSTKYVIQALNSKGKGKYMTELSN